MNKKIIGCYANSNQHEYIIAQIQPIVQEKNDIEIEAVDHNNEIITSQEIKYFPTLLALKNGICFSRLTGKHNVSEVHAWFDRLGW